MKHSKCAITNAFAMS